MYQSGATFLFIFNIASFPIRRTVFVAIVSVIEQQVGVRDL